MHDYLPGMCSIKREPTVFSMTYLSQSSISIFSTQGLTLDTSTFGTLTFVVFDLRIYKQILILVFSSTGKDYRLRPFSNVD